MPNENDRACGADAAAYALGALEAAEAEAFRRHMAECVVCRDEVEAFRHTVDLLPLAAAQQSVPRGLKRRVMHAVRHDGDAPPARATSRRLTLRPVIAGAAALLVVAAIAIGVALGTSSPAGRHTISAQVIGPGSARMTIAPDGRAELIVRNLPQPSAGDIYEVWLKRGDHSPAPTRALFGVTTAGAGDVGIPGDVRGVSEVLVTQEPAGGSRVPTHAPVIVVRL